MTDSSQPKTCPTCGSSNPNIRIGVANPHCTNESFHAPAKEKLMQVKIASVEKTVSHGDRQNYGLSSQG